MAQSSWNDGHGPGSLRWREDPRIYPDLQEAVWRAHSGWPGMGQPAGLRVPHPTVKDAAVVVEPPFLWILYRIRKGVDRRERSEGVYRSTPSEWMLALLLPAEREQSEPFFGRLKALPGEEGSGLVHAVDMDTRRHVGDIVPSDCGPGLWRAVVIDPLHGFHFVCVDESGEALVDRVQAGTETFRTVDEALSAISRNRLL